MITPPHYPTINVSFESLKGPIIVPLAVSRQDANLQAPLGPGCCFESPYELDARKSHDWRWFSVSIAVQVHTGVRTRRTHVAETYFRNNARAICLW